MGWLKVMGRQGMVRVVRSAHVKDNEESVAKLSHARVMIYEVGLPAVVEGLHWGCWAKA